MRRVYTGVCVEGGRMKGIQPDYNSPAELKAFLEANNMAMQKKFGQNFLINEQARMKIIDALDVKAGTSVWEVGPGLGAMTAEMLRRGARLTVFEIDRGFVSALRQFFSAYIEAGFLRIVEGDVMKTWGNELSAQGMPERFFGNLPYNIAAALIADTIEKSVRFEKVVFTVQKEVAMRAAAKPGTSDYSSFSILCQWAYRLKPIIELSGGNFWPRPNVTSSAFFMEKTDSFPGCDNPALFMKLLRALFSSRRKNIRNNLSAFLSNPEKAEHILRQAGIDQSVRAEALPVQSILQLSDVLNADIISSEKK